MHNDTTNISFISAHGPVLMTHEVTWKSHVSMPWLHRARAACKSGLLAEPSYAMSLANDPVTPEYR